MSSIAQQCWPSWVARVPEVGSVQSAKHRQDWSDSWTIRPAFLARVRWLNWATSAALEDSLKGSLEDAPAEVPASALVEAPTNTPNAPDAPSTAQGYLKLTRKLASVSVASTRAKLFRTWSSDVA
jgi:hypothetical protein